MPQGQGLRMHTTDTVCRCPCDLEALMHAVTCSTLAIYARDTKSMPLHGLLNPIDTSKIL